MKARENVNLKKQYQNIGDRSWHTKFPNMSYQMSLRLGTPQDFFVRTREANVRETKARMSYFTERSDFFQQGSQS